MMLLPLIARHFIDCNHDIEQFKCIGIEEVKVSHHNGDIDTVYTLVVRIVGTHGKYDQRRL